MRGAHTFAIVAMKIFVKQQIIFEVLVLLQFFTRAKYRTKTFFISCKDAEYPAAQFIGHFV